MRLLDIGLKTISPWINPMANKERSFCTEVKRSFEALGAWAFKLPDMPHFAGMNTRFDIAKPFDMLVILGGRAIAIEAKSINDFKAFGMRYLRDCQIKGLDEFAAAGGESYVILNVRRPGNKEKGLKRVNRLYIFDWSWLKNYEIENGSIKKPILEAADFGTDKVYITDGAKGMFPLGAMF